MNDDIFAKAFESLDDILSSDLSNFHQPVRRILNPNKLDDWDRAVDHYEEIRKDESDIEKIAMNLGKTSGVVSRVKEHIFFKSHSIIVEDIEQIRRLDEDPEIVNSWCRLRDGDHVGEDENLFRHEQLESIIVLRKKVSQTEAHLRTLAAGYSWNPDEAYNGDISNS